MCWESFASCECLCVCVCVCVFRRCYQKAMVGMSSVQEWQNGQGWMCVRALCGVCVYAPAGWLGMPSRVARLVQRRHAHPLLLCFLLQL